MAAPPRAARRRERSRTWDQSRARNRAGKAASRPSDSGSATRSPAKVPMTVPVVQQTSSSRPAPTSRCRSRRPSSRWAIAQDSSTISWAVSDPPPPRALEGRGRGQADRAVAEVEQDGGDDRRDQAAAGAQDRGHGELGRPGEGGHRHHHRGDPAHVGGAGQHPERDPEGEGRDPDRGGRPHPVQVGRPPGLRRLEVGRPPHTTLRPARTCRSPAVASRSPAPTSRYPNAAQRAPRRPRRPATAAAAGAPPAPAPPPGEVPRPARRPARRARWMHRSPPGLNTTIQRSPVTDYPMGVTTTPGGRRRGGVDNGPHLPLGRGLLSPSGGPDTGGSGCGLPRPDLG